MREQLPENQAQLEAAIWLFQHEVCSLGKASQLSGLSVYLFQSVLASRSIPISYDTEDFREDLNTLDQNKIFQKTS
ncbi:hypothetical protein BLX24_22855 [Arsenicibacter rosenii]|uniref:Uncharacterized protein n=1 Tax=Arsenicibacter rosenii TaxID=1750698 RepID=A0A1S2VEM2_9BACT|nr:hypothetical protein BLX24_22855 [Arsenicibacter rosenii]